MKNAQQTYYFMLFIIAFFSTLIIIPVCFLLFFPRFEGNLLYLRLMIAYPISLILINAIQKKSSGETLRKLIGPLDKKLFLLVFITTTLLSLTGSMISGEIMRNDAALKSILISSLISILFIPLQCLSEELIFRILPQKIILSDSFSSPMREKNIASVISSALFSLLHLPNSEALLFNSILLSFLYFFLSGIFLCALTFIEKGYTANISYHIANNIFIAALINRKDGETIPSEPFFFYEGNFDVFHTIISLVWAIIIIMAVEMIYIRHSRRAQIGKKDN